MSGGLQNGMPTIVGLTQTHGLDLMADLIGVPQGNYIRDLRRLPIEAARFALTAQCCRQSVMLC